MRSLVKIISGLALIGSILWFYQVGGWEPIVAALTALAALIGLFVSDKTVSSNDPAVVKTDEPIIRQTVSLPSPVKHEFDFLSGKVSLHIPKGSPHEVFYKKPFKRIPHLEINRRTELGNFEIVEQRPDGFKVRSPDYDKIYFEWSAEGEFEKSDN